MKYRRKILLLLPLLLLTTLAGLYFGSTTLSFRAFFAALTGTGEETHRLILWQLRLPRVLAGIIAGVGLSTAGVLLQSVTANLWPALTFSASIPAPDWL